MLVDAVSPTGGRQQEGKRAGGSSVRVAVTGGAGFIGHHLVGGLLARGHQVNVIDDFSTGMPSRLARFGDRIALTEGTILDAAALDRTLEGCEVVFHEAAIASVARSLVEPRVTNEVNVSGTIEVMLAAARHRVRRVVFAGSSAVYGIPAKLPCRETQRPNPVSPYGASKLAAEHYIDTLGRALGVETVALRYFNVFGPGQDPASEYAAVVPRFVTAALEGRQPTINGTGETSRDYIYVDNVVEANLLASRSSSPSGLTCNIASGSRISLVELAQAICAAAGRAAEPIFGPPRQGDIPHSLADVSVARRALGYRVSVPFAEGISRTLAWYRSQGGGWSRDPGHLSDDQGG
jgi:UDP-glucose 4-epimerase